MGHEHGLVKLKPEPQATLGHLLGPGLDWLLMAGYGWLLAYGQGRQITTPDTVQLIIIDLLHFLAMFLEVLVIVLTLCVLALVKLICCLPALSL